MLAIPTACDDDPIPEPEPTPTPQPESEPEPVPKPTPVDTVKTKSLCWVADWSDALSEADIPNVYSLFIDDTLFVADAFHPMMYEDSISQEPYTLLAYNQPKDITIANRIASIQEKEEGLLVALPEYLFAADTTVSVEAGDTSLVSLRMRRLLAPLTLTLHFTDTAEVSRAEATLSGLISAIHLPDGAPAEASPLRVAAEGTALLYVETLSGGQGIVMHLRTFGIVPELHQLLHVSITLSDGRELTFDADLTGKLGDLAHLEPIALAHTLETAKPEEPGSDPEEPDEPDVPEEPDGPDEPVPAPDPEPNPEPTPTPDPDLDMPVDKVEVGDWDEEDLGPGEAELVTNNYNK